MALHRLILCLCVFVCMLAAAPSSALAQNDGVKRIQLVDETNAAAAPGAAQADEADADEADADEAGSKRIKLLDDPDETDLDAPDDEDKDDDDAVDENDDAGGDDQDSALPVTEDSGEGAVKGHGFQLSMSFLGIPGAIMENWFVNHGEVWDGVVNMGVSFDYTLRFRVPCEMRFSLSWFNARTGDAYWLSDEFKKQPALADYIHNDLSMINIEVAAYHMVRIIDAIDFYYGGGIWGGVILGEAKSYAIRQSCAESSDDITKCPHEPGSVSVTGLPDVFGFVMVTLGFKFKFLDVMTARVEGGFKGYFYGQVALGVEF